MRWSTRSLQMSSACALRRCPSLRTRTRRSPERRARAHAVNYQQPLGCSSRVQNDATWGLRMLRIGANQYATRRLLMSTMDRIEKNIVLRAPQERMWNAISDAKQFGTWFGVEFDGPFVAGTHMKGRMTPTKVDRDVAKRQEADAGMTFDCTIERIEPMTLFSFRWHPFAIDPKVDYSKEPTTLVVFKLAG